MSLEPPGTFPPTDAVEDDSLIVDGLERALAHARTTLPDHDRDADVELPSLAALIDHHTEPKPEPAAADLAIDSSAVMSVLREAIDRYTNGDGHELGTWDDSVAAVPTVALDAPHRHVVAGYERDRRRLAAVVVVLFFLVFGFGYQRFGGGGGSDKVSTQPTATVKGQAVTTLGRTTVTSPITGEVVPPPDPTTDVAAPATGGGPATTTHHGGTTNPPGTDPPSTDPPSTDPVTTDTTATTDTTSTTDTTTTTAPTPTTTCTTDPIPICQ